VAQRRALLFDSSVLIPIIRGEADEALFQRALRTGRARLSSVVMQELYAGARTRADKKNYDGISQAFVRRGYMVTPNHDEWILSGVLLARYQQQYGEVEPRDHINDILIALCAVQAGATLVTENVSDMERWKRMLGRSGKTFRIQSVTR